jgi:threonine synthase
VLCITGNGLKTTDVLAGKYETETPIAPKLREFEALLESRLSGVAHLAGGAPALPVSTETPALPLEA